LSQFRLKKSGSVHAEKKGDGLISEVEVGRLIRRTLLNANPGETKANKRGKNHGKMFALAGSRGPHWTLRNPIPKKKHF